MKPKNLPTLAIILSAIFLTLLSTQTLAQQSQADYWNKDYSTTTTQNNDKINVTLTTTFVSKYIWRGFDMLDDRGAVQPQIDLDWFNSGFSTTVFSSIPFSHGLTDSQELRYINAYSGSLNPNTPAATNYSLIWTYYDFFNTFSGEKDLQEAGLNLAWPRLIPLSNTFLVPNYYLAKTWPAESNALNRNQGGWIHILSLGCDFPVYGIVFEQQIVHLSSELVYNDGQGTGNVAHDFSHAVFGFSTKLKSENLTVIPAVNYQISMEDTVNNENELWYGITFQYKF